MLERTQVKPLPTVESGERTNAAGKPVSNKILLALPNDEYRAIRLCLEHLTRPSHLTLHEPSETPEYVHFPNGGGTSSSTYFLICRPNSPREKSTDGASIVMS